MPLTETDAGGAECRPPSNSYKKFAANADRILSTGADA